jgi:hypothetical protein
MERTRTREATCDDVPPAGESLFREVNERIRALSERWQLEDGLLQVICECDDDTCTSAIAVPVDVFDGVRARPGQKIVSARHRLDDGVVVTRARDFAVVDRPPPAPGDPA